MSKKPSNVATLIKRKREKRKLSQADLAKFLGWNSAQFVSNIENGISEWPREHLPKVAKILLISQQELWNAYDKDCQLEFKGMF